MQFLNSFCIFLVNYSSVCLRSPICWRSWGSFLRAPLPSSSPRLSPPSSSSLSPSSPPALPSLLSSLQLPVSSAGRQTRRGRHPEVTSCHALDFFPALKKNNHKSARRGFKKTRCRRGGSLAPPTGTAGIFLWRPRCWGRQGGGCVA